MALAESHRSEVQRLFEPLTEWQMQRLPPRPEGSRWIWIRRCLNVIKFDTRFDLLLSKVVDLDNRLTRIEAQGR